MRCSVLTVDKTFIQVEPNQRKKNHMSMLIWEIADFGIHKFSKVKLFAFWTILSRYTKEKLIARRFDPIRFFSNA